MFAIPEGNGSNGGRIGGTEDSGVTVSAIIRLRGIKPEQCKTCKEEAWGCFCKCSEKGGTSKEVESTPRTDGEDKERDGLNYDYLKQKVKDG